MELVWYENIETYIVGFKSLVCWQHLDKPNLFCQRVAKLQSLTSTGFMSKQVSGKAILVQAVHIAQRNGLQKFKHPTLGLVGGRYAPRDKG